MKISLRWLSDYVELPGARPGSVGDVDEVARRLTMAGLEVEGISHPGAALQGVVVAQIRESTKHPNADKLSVTRVEVAGGQTLQIVCGAKNYQVGDKVPLATAGTKLPNGVEIKASALRGVESAGMLCSARELGLSEEASGLMILSPDAPLGAPIAQALGLDDVVLEVNLTPNRPDGLSHLGIARELSALTGAPLKLPKAKLAEAGGKAVDRIKVRIDEPVRCPRYAARVIEGVKIGPSPDWLARRLELCGIRAINNVVDVTNYVLLEYGQPLHAFDLDKLKGGEIVVRRAKPSEKLTTLDGKERSLDADDLLICDKERAHVLAGVMGGAESEVSPATKNLMLECAHFQPTGVRRSSKRHGLHTESSHRFERGADVEVIGAVIDRAAALIAELAGGKVLEGVVDNYPNPPAPRVVPLRWSRVSRVLGVEVPETEGRKILASLGFESESDAYRIPSWRVDVAREEDLIEEVARIRGYETIPAALPRSLAGLSAEPPSAEIERRVRQALAGAGFSEVVNYSFVSPAELDALGVGKGAIAVENPLSVEQSAMRTTLFAGLLQNVSRNLRHQVDSVRQYELGRTYVADPHGGRDGRPVAVESLKVAAVLWGRRDARGWTVKDDNVDFYDAKGAVESVLDSLAISGVRFEPASSSQLHPKASASVTALGANGERRALGTLGQVHPKAAKALGVPQEVYLLELDFDALCAAACLVPKHRSVARYPAVLRDLAVVVPRELPNDEVRRLILEVGAPLVEEARVFDVYTGKQIPEGKKNLAYALRFRSNERTLNDAEVTEAHTRIVAEVNRRLGGALRG